MTFKSKLMGAAASVLPCWQVLHRLRMAEDLTVAYFLEWPMPFQYAKQTGMYEEAMGTTINLGGL